MYTSVLLIKETLAIECSDAQDVVTTETKLRRVAVVKWTHNRVTIA